MNFLQSAFSIFAPPFGVLLAYGVSTTLLIKLLLTWLWTLPGSNHAVWAITKHYGKADRQAY